MKYPHLKERFCISKVLFALVFIGFLALIYLHAFLRIVSTDLLLRLFGLMLIAESIAKFLLFPYHESEHPLNYGRLIRVLVGLYLVFHPGYI